MNLTEYGLKNSFVIKKDDGKILKFADGYTIIYGNKDSAEEDVIEGDTIIAVFDLEEQEKNEAVESIKYHCS